MMSARAPVFNGKAILSFVRSEFTIDSEYEIIIYRFCLSLGGTNQIIDYVLLMLTF
jgi:hypothetical protein